jgi:hypothetical protein
MCTDSTWVSEDLISYKHLCVLIEKKELHNNSKKNAVYIYCLHVVVMSVAFLNEGNVYLFAYLNTI